MLQGRRSSSNIFEILLGSTWKECVFNTKIVTEIIKDKGILLMYKGGYSEKTSSFTGGRYVKPGD